MSEKIGQYEIRGVAGRGAMGTVYDAWDAGRERRVAIKTLSLGPLSGDDREEQLRRFEREAEVVRGLDHPNIVKVFDAGQTETDAFLVMEFLDGQSLKQILDSGTRFTIENTLWLMTGLLGALGYSHASGVVHRDIKPANIMVTRDGLVKVTDFGVARIEGSELTRTGLMIGTPAYMSPEQFLAEPVDARSDIYSVGTLLFQLLTGERAFEGSLTSITYKVLHSQVPRPSAIAIQAPAAVDAVVLRAMARNPSERYRTAESFLAALNEALSQPAGTAETVIMDRSAAAQQSGATRRANLSHIPALPVVVDPIDDGNPSRFGGLLWSLMSIVVLAAVFLIGYDVFNRLPLGTLPNLAEVGRLSGVGGGR